MRLAGDYLLITVQVSDRASLASRFVVCLFPAGELLNWSTLVPGLCPTMVQ